jgi:hypothetical protein
LLLTSVMGLNEAAVAALRFVAELGAISIPGVARLKSTDRGSWISDNAEHDLENIHRPAWRLSAPLGFCGPKAVLRLLTSELS